MQSLTLRDQIDARFFAPKYILDAAYQSYRHWWSGLGFMLDIEYQHLNPNPHRKPFGYRWKYERRQWGPEVSHVVELPTGENIAYSWISGHGHYRYWKGDRPFRQRQKFQQHGIEKKVVDQSRQDWRERKGFKKDKAARHRCHRCCGKWMKGQINRENRRANKRLIYSEKWEQLPTHAEPRDTWRWD